MLISLSVPTAQEVAILSPFKELAYYPRHRLYLTKKSLSE